MKPISNFSKLFIAIICIVLFFACSKGTDTRRSDFLRLHTSHMSGSWKWKDSIYIHNPVQDTGYSLPDSSFAIVVLNDSILNVGGNTLVYYDTTKDGAMTYYCSFSLPHYNIETVLLSYYYKKDSITIADTWSDYSAKGGWYYHSP